MSTPTSTPAHRLAASTVALVERLERQISESADENRRRVAASRLAQIERQLSKTLLYVQPMA